MKNEHPILFSTPMVKAILNGRKTQTRRIIKSPTGRFEIATANYEPNAAHYYHNREVTAIDDNDHDVKTILCPYGKPSDVLWVRETFIPPMKYGTIDRYIYKASENLDCFKGYWKPSIFMPKEACRIRLEITDIRVERLCDITEEDAMAEGITLPNYAEQSIKDVHYPEPSDIYAELWDKINGTGSWIKNLWVWVIEFKVIR